MSTISSAASASAAPIVSAFSHGHKKGGHVASSTDSSATSSTQGATTNQGLFSSLLDSFEQAMGFSLTAPASASSANTAAAATASTAAGATANTAAAADGATQLANTLGVNINAKA